MFFIIMSYTPQNLPEASSFATPTIFFFALIGAVSLRAITTQFGFIVYDYFVGLGGLNCLATKPFKKNWSVFLWLF